MVAVVLWWQRVGCKRVICVKKVGTLWRREREENVEKVGREERVDGIKPRRNSEECPRIGKWW